MNKMFAIFGGALGLYIVIVLFIAVGPAIDLSMTPPGPGVHDLTPLQKEGREIYAGNGCGYCHTQQVRPIHADAVFGRPSAPGDFTYQTPELLGSERTGPDLTNVGVTKGSDVWQYIHLYDPRAVESHSIMPNFKFLFREVKEVPPGETAVPIPAAFAPKNGDKVIPTPQAKALVAYLLSLKQAPIPGYQMNGGMGGPTSAAPAASAPASSGAPGGYTFDPAKGASLFDSTCAACHQSNGEGVPGAFPPLKGNAVVDNPDATQHIDTVLHGAHGLTIGGVKYPGAMPPFASQLSDADIANIVNHERSSWGNHSAEVTPADVAAVRAGKKLGAASSAPAGSAPATSAAASAPAASAAAGGYTFDAAKGASLFTANCAACHQANGEGLPGAFPSLHGNPAVADADPTLHIHTVLFGAQGVTIGGVKYTSAMPPFGGQLNDADIADIINHERSSWGNHSKQVTPSEVAAVRAKGK